uniref:Syntaxin-2 n=1 Tax=Phallusia mammillata TaxID=59560 RepID=A0A6F9DUX4_9ASCI|nr:syntaxin-2 [Phallusia mammillata]
MIRDRLPDLLRLARRNPSKYFEPEHHEEVPMPLEMTMVLSRAEKVQKFLLEMDKMLQELQVHYGGMIASSSSQSAQQKQVASTMNRFTALTRKTRSILQRMDLTEQETIKYYQPEPTMATVRWSQSEPNVQVSWKRPSLTTLLSISIPAEIRIKLTLHGVLSFRLAELVKEYYTVQKKHNEMTRIKVQRQMSIIGRSLDQQELDRALDEGEMVPLIHSNIVDDQQVNQEMRARLKEVEHFEKEILALEKNISQLHDAFVTMSTIVHEQGAIVDRIEHHLTISSDYVESSKHQLKKATKLQHKYRKKRCCIFILVLVLLVIIAAIIALSIKRPGTVRHPKAISSKPSVAHPSLRRSDWTHLRSMSMW